MKNRQAGKNNKNGEKSELVRMVSAAVSEAERFIGQIGEQVKGQAANEADRVLGEYEQKIQQIVFKAKQELNARSLEVAEKIRHEIMFMAGKTSTSIVDAIISDTSKRAEGLASKLQSVTAEPESTKAVVKAKEGTDGGSQPDTGGGKYKPARVAAEFQHEIENLGHQDESDKGGKAKGREDKSTAVKDVPQPSPDGDGSEIDEFMRYLSQ